MPEDRDDVARFGDLDTRTAPESPEDPRWIARRALADALRALEALCVESDADASTLEQAARDIEALTADLSTRGRRSARQSVREGMAPAEALAWVDRGAMLGRANPIAPPVRLRIEDGRVIGDVTFGPQHGGAPGLVHGGLVATLLDEVLGNVPIKQGVPVATATLDIRYVAPTPLGVPLRAEAWLVRCTGRRYFVAGEVFAGDVQTARAQGVFVDIRGSSFARAIEAQAATGD